MYPKIERAYRLARDLRKIYQITSKSHAFNALRAWVGQAKDASIDHFEVARDTIDNHLEGILAFFNIRSTNAHAESFNAQITLFPANPRGFNGPTIFIYRLQKVFA
jgi:transposase